MGFFLSSGSKEGRTVAIALLLCWKFSNCFVVGAEQTAQNVDMYDGNSADVIRNLISSDKYGDIYLKYHQCVWSEYGNSADDYDNGCGGDGNDEYWYMGRTPCYRANVAYSLYGIPKGQTSPKNPCQKDNYINSFFTTHGVDTFAKSIGIDYGDATSQCNAYGDYGDANQRSLANNYLSSNELLYPNAASYTTSCSRNGNFVQSLYQGAFCSSRSNVTMLDDLESLNQQLTNMECTNIYTADSDNGYNDNNAGGEDAADQGIMELLAYSSTCFSLEYPRSCPDPHGAKRDYSFTPESKRGLWNRMNWMDHISIILLILSAILLIFPCLVEKKEEEKVERRGILCFRSRTKNKKGRRGLGMWFRTKVLRRSESSTARRG